MDVSNLDQFALKFEVRFEGGNSPDAECVRSLGRSWRCAPYHVGRHHHITQTLAVRHFNDALHQKGALARQGFFQANGPARDDVMTRPLGFKNLDPARRVDIGR